MIEAYSRARENICPIVTVHNGPGIKIVRIYRIEDYKGIPVRF